MLFWYIWNGTSDDGFGEPVQTRADSTDPTLLIYTQSMDVDEDSDQILDLSLLDNYM